MASSTFLPLSLLLLLLLISSASSETCKSQKFKTPNKSYSSCNDLPHLSASLHWSFDSSTSILSIAFTAIPAKSSGWVAWGINPISPAMTGSQALLAYKSSNGSISVSSYNLKSYTEIIQGPISYSVSSISAESSGNSLTIFGNWKLPPKTDFIHQVWQVGSTVTDGMPIKHDFAPQNLASKGNLNLTQSAASAVAPATAGKNQAGEMIRVPVCFAFLIALSSLFLV